MKLRDHIYFVMRCVTALALFVLLLKDPLRAIATCFVILVLPIILQIPEETFGGRKVVPPTAVFILLATLAGAGLIAANILKLGTS